MKCIVFSDSHGNPSYMRHVLNMHKDAEVVFFLGDGLADFDEVMSQEKTRVGYAVVGNCDFYKIYKDTPARKTEEIQLLGKKIVYTHGDLYGAKYGMGGLVSLGERLSADIVLFGHTHTPHEEYVSKNHPLYLFNPGSIGSYPRSFGIMTLTENAPPLFSFGATI